MIKKQICIMIFVTTAIWFTAGCARTKDVRIITNPSNAEVFVDKESVGKTPVTVNLTVGDDHQIVIVKQGYKTVPIFVESYVSAAKVVATIIFLIPVAVLVAIASTRGSTGHTSFRGVSLCELDVDKEIKINLQPED